MQATVNYHILSPEEQAFHIDAGGEKGKLVSPVLVPTEIKVGDVRYGEAAVDFLADSVAFVKSRSNIARFDEPEDWQSAYDEELHALLRQQIGAREVIVFDHTVRIDNPNSERKPARNVHGDYSPAGAHKRLEDILGAEKAKQWEAGHFGFVNVWRSVQNPINGAPLGFVRPQSVSAEDWLTIKLIYPDRTGQIMGLVANEAHEWVYLSKMTPKEVAIFNIYDNQGLASIAHSALDVALVGAVQSPRMSIESRTLIRY